MGLSLSLSATQDQVLTHTLTLRKVIGESSGDIPVYSLHRIRSFSAKNPIGLSKEIDLILTKQIIIANQEYQEESGTKKYCLTSQGLVDVIERLNEFLEKGINAVKGIKPEKREDVLRQMHEAREEIIRTIQQWFYNNYEDLRYNMDGKIPWPVVCMLRKKLELWIADRKTNPFAQDIEEMILETASGEGINVDDAEEAWTAMGGKIFKK